MLERELQGMVPIGDVLLSGGYKGCLWQFVYAALPFLYLYCKFIY